MTVSQHQRTYLPACVLVFLAALPRLVRPDLAEYKLDESTAVLNALAILQHHALPLQGQGSSLGGAAQGPLFYDVVALVLAVGHDPRAVDLTIGLVNSLAVGLSYVVIRRAFGTRVGLIAAILFAGSSWSIVFSRKIWPNDLLAPLAVVALWGLLSAVDPAAKRAGLGRSWLAVALMGSLNLSAWPLVLVPALAQVVVPRTRRGRALAWSLAGLIVLVVAAAVEARTLGVIATDLTARTGPARTFDLSPLSYVVQLVGTDGFQPLAGPLGSLDALAGSTAWLDRILRVLLFLGVVVAGWRSVDRWRRSRHLMLTPEVIILLWWITPALAALYRPVPVFIHHFLGTLPCQFILVALAIDWLARSSEPSLERAVLGLARIVRSSGWIGDVDRAPAAESRRSPKGPDWLVSALREQWRLPSARQFARTLPSIVGCTFALVAFVVQVRALAVLLVFVQAHPAGTFFGVPLGSSLVAASDARAAAGTGPVYVLSDGDLVGVDDIPTVIDSLVGQESLHYLRVDQTIVFPARGTATYYVAPDSVGQFGETLIPWQQVDSGVSPLSVLQGGYLRFRAGPVGPSLPPQWRGLDRRAADESTVVGYLTPRQIAPGAPFEVDVLWKIGQPAAAPQMESIFAHLVDDRGRVVAGEDFAPLPTTRWVTGADVLNRFTMEAPPDLPPDRYWIDFGRYRRPGIQPVRFVDAGPDSDATSVRLGPLAVAPPTRVPRGLQPVYALFGGQIRLDAWQAEEASGKLHIALLWAALNPPAGDYTVFVHLVSPDGQIVAQSDSQPRDGQFPTATWESGDRALERRAISLDGVPPGDYQVVVGLYTLATGQRLAIGGHDAYQLGQISVSPEPSG